MMTRGSIRCDIAVEVMNDDIDLTKICGVNNHSLSDWPVGSPSAAFFIPLFSQSPFSQPRNFGKPKENNPTIRMEIVGRWFQCETEICRGTREVPKTKWELTS